MSARGSRNQAAQIQAQNLSNPWRSTQNPPRNQRLTV
jgi:hypothetical protein